MVANFTFQGFILVLALLHLALSEDDFILLNVNEYGRFSEFRVVSAAEVTPSRRLTTVPDLRNQSPEEAKYLKFHKCMQADAAYGAAYLMTKDHLLQTNILWPNLTTINCEWATFLVTAWNADPAVNDVPGTILMTLDVLDFGVIHLSWFERLQFRHLENITSPDLFPIKRASHLLRHRALKRRHTHASYSPRANRTIALMPFFAAGTGDLGNSRKEGRFAYTPPCFWSLFHEFPNIAIFVANDQDEASVR